MKNLVHYFFFNQTERTLRDVCNVADSFEYLVHQIDPTEDEFTKVRDLFTQVAKPQSSGQLLEIDTESIDDSNFLWRLQTNLYNFPGTLAASEVDKIYIAFFFLVAHTCGKFQQIETGATQIRNKLFKHCKKATMRLIKF